VEKTSRICLKTGTSNANKKNRKPDLSVYNDWSPALDVLISSIKKDQSSEFPGKKKKKKKKRKLEG
jgi:hypothetical protein